MRNGICVQDWYHVGCLVNGHYVENMQPLDPNRAVYKFYCPIYHHSFKKQLNPVMKGLIAFYGHGGLFWGGFKSQPSFFE